MERVIKYVNEKFKYSGNTIEVQNQKEELIASLHDKIYDVMSKGKTEDDAFKEAVASLDELAELTEALDGRHRKLYVNRLNFHHGLITFAVIALELLAGIVLFLLGKSNGIEADTSAVVGMFVALFVMVIISLVYSFIFVSNPKKTDRVEFNFRKAFTASIIGWLALSILLTIINIATLPLMDEKVIWFIWPMIGISNWPIALIIYNILYKSKKYIVH